MQTEYISLGNSCAVAYQLQQLGVRRAAYPFDWVNCSKLSGIISLFENYDKLLEDPIFKCESVCYPIIEDNWKEEISSTLKVYDPQFKIIFPHDFKDKADITEIKLKYKRRFERLFRIMRDPSVHKVLIRISHITEDLSYLKHIFNNNNFVNYTIIFKSYEELGNSKDWKFSDYNWASILDLA